MFKIGEFSKLTQVSVRMLRYYDEMNLLKPAQIDSWSGYRMYSIEQIPILNKIIYLRDSGFHVQEIADMLANQNESYMLDHIHQKYQEITNNIHLEQAKLKKLELAKNELLDHRNEMHYHISIKSIPCYQVLSLRKRIPDYYAEGILWKELSDFIKFHKIEITNETFSIYHDEDYREEDVDVELCVIVKKPGKDIAPFQFRQSEAVPIMATTMVYGDFSNIAYAYHQFAKWLQDHAQYKMKGANRQIVHRGPWNETDPHQYLTEIQIPLEK